MVNKGTLLLFLALLGASTSPCAAQQYVVTDLGALPNNSSWATAVNQYGEAAGLSFGGTGYTSAVAFRHGTVVDLGNLGFPDSRAFGINSAGDVVGVSANGAMAPRCCARAFLYRAGTMIDLGTLGGQESLAYGINDRLEIVGMAQIAGGLYHAFLFSDGGMTDLGAYAGNSWARAINSLGQIAGSVEYNTSFHTHAALFTRTGFVDLGAFGGFSATAVAINDAGQIAGTRSRQEGIFAPSRAFLYDTMSGAFRDLGTLGGLHSTAHGLNAGGDVVGGALDGSNHSRAFLYTGGVMTDLNSLIPTASGWFLSSATAINDSGQIVGIGQINGRDHGFMLSRLPGSWTNRDIGAVGTAGTASYANGVFTVKGAGTIWGTSDTFHFVSQPVTGDVTIVARITSMEDSDPFAKAGVMLRASNAPDAAHVILDLRPTTDLEFMTRPTPGAETTFLGTARQAPPTWVRLVRRGTTVTAAVSGDGVSWTTIGSTTLDIGPSSLVGLVVGSNTSGVDTATFDNVTIIGSAAETLPSPWTNRDVGAVGTAGTASYANGVFTVKGAGTIWGTSDTFHFVSQPVTGDVTIVARITSMEDTDPFAKAGVMLRASNAPDAAHVILDLRPTTDLEFMTRPTPGAETTFLGTARQAPTWVRLVRRGTTVTAAVSGDGVSWTTIGSTTLDIGPSSLVGLVVGSNTSGVDTATFDNVTVIGSAAGTADGIDRR